MTQQSAFLSVHDVIMTQIVFFSFEIAFIPFPPESCLFFQVPALLYCARPRTFIFFENIIGRKPLLKCDPSVKGVNLPLGRIIPMLVFDFDKKKMTKPEQNNVA